MNLYLSLFIFINSATSLLAFSIIQIDSAHLLGLFQPANNQFNTLIRPTDTNPNQNLLTLPSFFEEQCAIKCLRNTHCASYFFNAGSRTCQLSLIPNLQRELKPDLLLAKQINCDLNQCSHGLYCSSKGACLCEPSSHGSDCSVRPVYELSSWSDWSKCTADCDQPMGFKQRQKDCVSIRASGTMNTTLTNMKWLCTPGSLDEQFQIMPCQVESCRQYGDWSEWSPCTKICGGYTIRTRQCYPNAVCDDRFLKQVKVCSFKDCESILIGKKETKKFSRIYFF